MIITTDYEEIVYPLPPTSTGMAKRCTFGIFSYDMLNKRVTMDFKIEYGKITEEVINAGTPQEETISTWETIDDPAKGISSYRDSFVADDTTIVDIQGNIVKFPNQDPEVDLEDPNNVYMGQFAFFYGMAKQQPILMEQMIRQFILQSINEGRFENF